MVTCSSVSFPMGEKVMRPVCLGPLTVFQPMAWLGMNCSISASHSTVRPSTCTDQCERLP